MSSACITEKKIYSKSSWKNKKAAFAAFLFLVGQLVKKIAEKLHHSELDL
ncbi:MAG: hypothetical protein V4660_04930 [Pseudomonadota bacterium]